SETAGVLISYRGFTFLDVGDLTWDKEMDLACPVNKLGRISLLLATHHGFFNDQSGAGALLWATQPQVVIANNGPRKGLGVPAFERIQKVKGLEGLWQSHLALASDKEHNTSDDMIANLEASTECKGHAIVVDARNDGSYTVTNTRNNVSKTYRAQSASAAAPAGQALFEQSCQSCHGPSGQGDRAPALNTGRFVRGDQDGDLSRAIRSGITGTPMPRSPSPNDDQLRQLVAYLRTRTPSPTSRPTPGPARSEDTFPSRFLDSTGVWHVVDKATREERRLMPGGITPSRLEKASAEPQN